VILIIWFLGNELSHYVKENISISVVLAEDLQEANIRSLREELEKQPYVKSTEFISKEQALQEMQRELGENPVSFLGFNPFRASIEIKLKSDYTHPDSLLLIEKRLSSNAGVTDVQYGKDMIQKVNQNIRRIGVVLLILLTVLIIISFVLINNTIRLLIYSKRFLLYTMRLVGATSSFIRMPFIRNNILNGLISGVLAILLLMGSLHYVKREFVNLEDILKSETMFLIYGIVLIAGIFISVIAAYFAVNRYLRISHNKLYSI
jgi:cell division transport system permease protein